MNKLDMQFHHIGLAVESIEDSLSYYVSIFGEDNVSEKYTVHSQGVNVCFIKNSDNSFIELVEPLTQNSSIHKFLKKGISYYHMAYETVDIEVTVQKLVDLNFKNLSYFRSEAFAGRRCIFLFSPDGQLIELIEK